MWRPILAVVLGLLILAALVLCLARGTLGDRTFVGYLWYSTPTTIRLLLLLGSVSAAVVYGSALTRLSGRWAKTSDWVRLGLNGGAISVLVALVLFAVEPVDSVRRLKWFAPVPTTPEARTPWLTTDVFGITLAFLAVLLAAGLVLDLITQVIGRRVRKGGISRSDEAA